MMRKYSAPMAISSASLVKIRIMAAGQKKQSRVTNTVTPTDNRRDMPMMVKIDFRSPRPQYWETNIVIPDVTP